MKKLFLLLLCVPLIFSCSYSEKKDNDKWAIYERGSNYIDSTDYYISDSVGDLITPEEFDTTGYINTNCPDLYDYLRDDIISDFTPDSNDPNYTPYNPEDYPSFGF